jgi:hypothetical protein
VKDKPLMAKQIEEKSVIDKKSRVLARAHFFGFYVQNLSNLKGQRKPFLEAL